MSAEHYPYHPLAVIQHGRTAFYEQLIDRKLEEVEDLTSRIHRWPIPRPVLLRERKRALKCLSWLGEQLTDSHANDAVLAQRRAPELPDQPAETTPATTVRELTSVNHDAAALAVFAVIEDGRLAGGDGAHRFVEIELPSSVV